MSGHEHEWGIVAEVVSCHARTVACACPCGAACEWILELEPAADPGVRRWLAGRCPRCAEIAAGSELRVERVEVAT